MKSTKIKKIISMSLLLAFVCNPCNIVLAQVSVLDSILPPLDNTQKAKHMEPEANIPHPINVTPIENAILSQPEQNDDTDNVLPSLNRINKLQEQEKAQPVIEETKIIKKEITSQAEDDEAIPLDVKVKPIEKPQTLLIQAQNQENSSKISRIIPQGSTLAIQFNRALNTKNCVEGQNVYVTLMKPIEENGIILIPDNSTVIGQITKLLPASHGDISAILEMSFNNIRTPRGSMIPIDAKIKTIDGSGVLRGGELDKQLSNSAGIVAISSVSGTLTGAGIAGLCGAAAVGSVIGLAVGATMGVNWIKDKKGAEIIIPAGTNLLLELNKTVTLAGD